MRIFLSIAFFPMLANECAAAETGVTYYVRANGGSADQCDGRSDSAYSGSGRGQSCAWRHPFEALPPGGPARIAGGDTLVIASGSYMMGMGAPGSQALEKCRTDWPWDCHAAAVPSGPSADRPTRIHGAGFDQGCSNAPELWGTQRASMVIDLAGSSNVELACLEITDHSSCIEFHRRADPVERCERDAQPYGDWASIGISASDSSNVRLSAVDIHGLAHDGIRAGRLRDWTLQNVKINANGWSGWNGDIGGSGSSNSGHLIFRDVEIAWNGCAEKYPGRQHFGCWGEENGGYGDGLGTGETGGTWLFERVKVHHNTQDGIDLLHAGPGATIAFKDVRAEANAGNQLKATGSVSIRNSVVIGSCSALAGASGLDPADICRAAGDSISLRVSTHAQDEIADSLVDGEGNCLISLTCAGAGCQTGTAVVNSDHLSGTASKTSANHSRLPCTVWVEPELRGAKLQFSNNEIHSVRSTACPAGIACSDNHE